MTWFGAYKNSNSIINWIYFLAFRRKKKTLLNDKHWKWVLLWRREWSEQKKRNRKERNKLNDAIELKLLPFQKHISFQNIIAFENNQLVVNFENFDSE